MVMPSLFMSKVSFINAKQEYCRDFCHDYCDVNIGGLITISPATASPQLSFIENKSDLEK